jgi:hypothetical protein
MKTVGITSGNCNLISPKQWLDILTIIFFFPAWKNTTNRSQINMNQLCILVELKLISMLLMQQTICEKCG